MSKNRFFTFVGMAALIMVFIAMIGSAHQPTQAAPLFDPPTCDKASNNPNCTPVQPAATAAPVQPTDAPQATDVPQVQPTAASVIQPTTSSSSVVPAVQSTSTAPLAVLPQVTQDPRGHQPVEVCHKPGTPAEHELTVDSNAVPAHLAHGDYLGKCHGAPVPTVTIMPETTPTATPNATPTIVPVTQTATPGSPSTPIATPINTPGSPQKPAPTATPMVTSTVTTTATVTDNVDRRDAQVKAPNCPSTGNCLCDFLTKVWTSVQTDLLSYLNGAAREQQVKATLYERALALLNSKDKLQQQDGMILLQALGGR